MKKGKFLLFAGILGMAFSAAFCSFAPKGNVKLAPAEEIGFKEANRNDDDLGPRILHFENKESEGEKKAGATPARQWEDKDTGFVVFGITMGVSVCLIGAMVALSIIKKKKANANKEGQQ